MKKQQHIYTCVALDSLICRAAVYVSVWILKQAIIMQE